MDILLCHYDKDIKTMQYQNSNFWEEFLELSLYEPRFIRPKYPVTREPSGQKVLFWISVSYWFLILPSSSFVVPWHFF